VPDTITRTFLVCRAHFGGFGQHGIGSPTPRVAEELVRYRPLVIRALPHSSPTLETAMIWPRWLDDQPAHRWLREVVTVMTKGLSAN